MDPGPRNPGGNRTQARKDRGGEGSGGREARRMVAEKAETVMKLQWAVITGKFGKNPVLATRRALRFTATAVEANRRRLT